MRGFQLLSVAELSDGFHLQGCLDSLSLKAHKLHLKPLQGSKWLYNPYISLYGQATTRHCSSKMQGKEKGGIEPNEKVSSHWILFGSSIRGNIVKADPADMSPKHISRHETALIARGTIACASRSHVVCLCKTPTPPPRPPPPPCILQGVWPSLCCQSPPNTQEAGIQ